jgi:hypothetical protein
LSLIALWLLIMAGWPGGSTPPANAQLAETPFSQLLALVPISAAQKPLVMLSYADYQALFAARPGAVWPADAEAWAAQDEKAQQLSIAVLTGLAGGMADLVRVLGRPQDMRTATGIDPFSIARSLEFGQPPTQGRLLQGAFNPEAIAGALTERGYTQTDRGGLGLWCPAGGCKDGLRINPAKREPFNPFGGSLGRQELFAFESTTLLNSPALETIEGMIAAFQGATKSVRDLPDYAAAMEAITARGALLQAMLMSADVTSTLEALNDPRLSPEARQRLRDRMRSVELPRYTVVAFAHVATGDAILTQVALVYETRVAAESAAAALPTRIADYTSTRQRRPFMTMLADRGATLEPISLVDSPETGKHIVLVTFNTPFESPDPVGDLNRPTPSGLIYRLLIQMLSSRDTDWLATGAAPEG